MQKNPVLHTTLEVCFFQFYITILSNPNNFFSVNEIQ